jgi:hypothetical protein
VLEWLEVTVIPEVTLLACVRTFLVRQQTSLYLALGKVVISLNGESCWFRWLV